MSLESADKYVLILGYRKDLARALTSLGIEFAVWGEKELSYPSKNAKEVVVAPFPKPSVKDDFEHIKALLKRQPTHVIAGSEAAVYPAAKLRRVFAARRSSDTMLTRCTDKLAMKNYLKKFDIAMTDFIEHTPDLTADELIAKLGFPLVIKDKKGSGGRNTVFAKTKEEVIAAMAKGRLYERFLSAPEGSIESIIENGMIKFTSLTEYFIKGASNIVPASYDQAEIDEIKELNEYVIRAMKVKWGMAHLEYYRTEEGIKFGEVALRPPGGYLMELISAAYDFDIWQAFAKVELGIEVGELPQQAKSVLANYIFHPGAGEVVAIKNLSQASYPHLVRSKIKVNVGDEVARRGGVGEDVGYAFLNAAKHSDVKTEINKIVKNRIVEVAPS